MKCYCLPGQCFQNPTGHSQDPQDNAKLTKFLDSFKLFCVQFSCTCFHVSAKLDVKESKFDISQFFTKPMYLFVHFVPKFLVQFIISVQTSPTKTYQKKNTSNFPQTRFSERFPPVICHRSPTKKPSKSTKSSAIFLVHPLPISIQPHRLCLATSTSSAQPKHMGQKHPLTYETSKKCVYRQKSIQMSCLQKKSMETSRYTVLHIRTGGVICFVSHPKNL